MSSSKNRIYKQYSLAACGEFSNHNNNNNLHAINSVDASKIKNHIHNLFEMIDKEIDLLINENICLKERIETLEELVENSGTRSTNTIIGGNVSHSITNQQHQSTLHSSSDIGNLMHNRNISSQQSKSYNHHQQQQLQQQQSQQQHHNQQQQQQQSTPFSVSSVKRDSMVAASQLSQKIKSTYKLKTSSKIFKSGQSSHLIATYEWHKDGIWYITSSQKNGHQYIATASADSTINICDVTRIDYNLQPCAIYAGHQSSVNCVKFHYNNDLMLTASGDGTGHIWRFNPELLHSDYDGDQTLMEEGTIIKTPLHELGDHHNVVVSCDWMYGLDQCVTASWDHMANIYDYQTGELIVQLAGHDQALTDVCACESTRLIVTSSQDTTFRLWDFRDAIHSVSVFQGHNRSVTSTCFLGADKILSGGDDRNVKVWDLKNMRSPLITISMESGINKLSVSQQHNLITIPLDNRNVRIYDINGNRICRLSRDAHTRMVICSTWLNDAIGTAGTNAQAAMFSNLMQQQSQSSSTSMAAPSSSMIMSPPPPAQSASSSMSQQSSSKLIETMNDPSNAAGANDFFGQNNNTLTLFTCAFDRRVCVWNISIEK